MDCVVGDEFSAGGAPTCSRMLLLARLLDDEKHRCRSITVTGAFSGDAGG